MEYVIIGNGIAGVSAAEVIRLLIQRHIEAKRQALGLSYREL